MRAHGPPPQWLDTAAALRWLRDLARGVARPAPALAGDRPARGRRRWREALLRARGATHAAPGEAAGRRSGRVRNRPDAFVPEDGRCAPRPPLCCLRFSRRRYQSSASTKHPSTMLWRPAMSRTHGPSQSRAAAAPRRATERSESSDSEDDRDWSEIRFGAEYQATPPALRPRPPAPDAAEAAAAGELVAAPGASGPPAELAPICTVPAVVAALGPDAAAAAARTPRRLDAGEPRAWCAPWALSAWRSGGSYRLRRPLGRWRWRTAHPSAPVLPLCIGATASRRAALLRLVTQAQGAQWPS